MNNCNVTDKVALIDLDGTVADYDKAMTAEMRKIQHPTEVPYSTRMNNGEEPAYMMARRKMIQSRPGFWRNLEQLKLGFEILSEIRKIGFNLHILTKAPSLREQNAPTFPEANAWSEKAIWSMENIPDALVHLSSDKSLMYGRVLMDDWPPYFLKWLAVRPRGLVVSVAQLWNKDVDHPNVIRYDGSNREEVYSRLLEAYNR